MQVIWQAKDIKSGIIVGKPRRKERWMIGYVVSGRNPTLNSMEDGMVRRYENAEDLAKALNSSGEVPVILIDDMRVRMEQSDG
jgi:hypothetical protein